MSTDFETALPASRSPFRLQLLGDLALYRVDGARVGEARRKPLAVLAYLAAESPRSVNRELLAALLWPDVAPYRARRSLAQTLYALRRELNADVVVGVTQLSLDGALITSDLAEFRAAVLGGDVNAAHDCYRGPFLDGMRVAGAAEFEQWAERWRDRIDAMHRALPAAPEKASLRAPVRSAPPSEPLSPSIARAGILPAFALRAALLAVMFVAGVAAVRSVTGRREFRERARSTASASSRQTYTQRLKAARLSTIDSSRIGRILVLPAVQVDGDSGTNVVASRVDTLVRLAINESFASTIPAADAARIEAQVERETARWPTTTSLQIAQMLKTAGAELAVRPIVTRRGDTTKVAMVYHRAVSQPARSTGGLSSVQSYSRAAILIPPTWRDRSYLDVRTATSRFVRTLERCDINSHYDFDDSPWCWGPGRRLIEPEASADKIRWEFIREQLQKHEQWRARENVRSIRASPSPVRRGNAPQ